VLSEPPKSGRSKRAGRLISRVVAIRGNLVTRYHGTVSIPLRVPCVVRVRDAAPDTATRFGFRRKNSAAAFGLVPESRARFHDFAPPGLGDFRTSAAVAALPPSLPDQPTTSSRAPQERRSCVPRTARHGFSSSVRRPLLGH
jgi:hypothetical protein